MKDEIKQQNKLLQDIQNYYTKSIKLYGRTAKGVDWNESDSQILRYEQLLTITEGFEAFSVLDYGCGYGILVDILANLNKDFIYLGLDISPLMIQAAQKHYLNYKGVEFKEASNISSMSDFIVASGIFNIKLNSKESVWRNYIYKTLDDFNKYSEKGFSFNCLSSYSDAEKRSSKLYYADPLILFDHCKRHYSDNVSLIHNYGLYEFTILVYK